MNTHSNNTATGAAGDHKPSMGEKISGTMDTMVGKMTNNPTKVAEGEAKKSGNLPSSGTQAHNTHGSHESHGTHGTHGTHNTGTHNSGTQTGLGGSHHTEEGYAGKPTLGERVGGEKDEMAGRFTNDPAQHAQGQARQDGITSGSGLGGHNTHSSGMTGHSGGLSHGGLTGQQGYGNENALGSSHHNTHSSGGLTGGHAGATSGLTGSHNNTAGAGYGNENALGSSHHNTHASGAGGLTHGTHSGTGYDNNNNTHGGKPSMGDKISGQMDTMVGKATNDPHRVAEGQEKKVHGTDAHGNTSAGGYGNSGAGGYGNSGAGAGGYGNTGSTNY